MASAKGGYKDNCAPEMMFLRMAKGSSRFNVLRNRDIQNQIKVSLFVEKVDEYRSREREHIQRMNNDYTKGIYFHVAHGSRNVRRARKRWSAF